LILIEIFAPYFLRAFLTEGEPSETGIGNASCGQVTNFT
jgi:hypothetical protein